MTYFLASNYLNVSAINSSWLNGELTKAIIMKYFIRPRCMVFINFMCDNSQFVVVFPVTDEFSIILASYFIQHVLMKFGMCHLTVIDNGTPFKGEFIAMREVLNLNHDFPTKRNHKGFTIENVYRFLNKSVTITAEGRGANDTFFLLVSPQATL